MTGDDSIIVIEVRDTCHSDDVIKVINKVDHFKKLFLVYASYKVYGAIAAMRFPKESIDLAKKYHYVCSDTGKR